MARAAKKETPLTIEEKLAKALVPEEEQPYPVPENWCWVYGNALLRPMETKRPSGTIFKYIDIDSIDNKRQAVIRPKNIETEKAPSRASRGLHNGDTIFSMVRPYLKNIAYIDKSIADSIASTGFYVCSPRENVYPRYLYYMMISPYVVDGLNTFMKGDNSPSIRKEELERFPYPLPPLPEQQRIVTLIESLFADLDAAKEKLQAVLDGFAERRAALLHQAFTGELTREWREKKGIRDDSWVEKKLEDCGNWSGGGTPSMNHPEYWDDGSIRWVTSKDMKAEIINDTQMHITAMGEQNSSAKLINSCAVLFVTRSGILRRTLPIAMISGKFTVNQDLKVLVPENNIDTKYLLRACQAREKRILDTCMKSGTTVESINFSALKTFVISVCSLSEQKEIVRILDDIFAKESQSKATVESALAKIDTMKKAILATAFRGGFETNDSSDESAKEPLRRVL